jgi:hypothetical protein
MNQEILPLNERSEQFWNSANGRLLLWAHSSYERELDLQRDSRTQRAKDTAFYDGDQFTASELQNYEDRNQEPRVFNEIKPTIDWILGSERRVRSDWNVLPRSENDVEPAIVKTKLIKYIDDINKARWQRSKAFEECIKSGEGWTRVCVEPDEFGDPQVKLKYEHWRNMVRDSTCRDTIGFTDCRYMWCTKVVDTESLEVWFPESKQALHDDSGDFEDLRLEHRDEMLHTDQYNYDEQSNGVITRSGYMTLAGCIYGGERKAVRIWELWYRKTEKVKVIRIKGRTGSELYNADDKYHQYLIQTGAAEIKETVREQMYVALYTRSAILFHDKSPYAHNKFPFVCRTAFIKDSDGTPYSVIRQIRDIQADLNARRNKALYLMSVNRVVMDEGAVEDVDKLAHEVARPDSIIEKKAHADFEIIEGGNLAAPHVQMAEMDAAIIRQVSGVTGENRGMDTTGKSGIAIQSLQEQGTVITTPLIDNHALAHQIEGELILSLCEQFIDREMQFRITGDDIQKPEFVTINDGKPETNITATQADFIVAQRDYRQTMRQALSEQMLAVSAQISQATGDPRMAVALIEMSIDLQDLPNKEQITARLREAAGLPPKDETDEQRAQREAMEQAQKQAQAQMAQQQAELAIRLDMARAAEMEASAKERSAEAEREQANAVRAKVDAAKALLEASDMLKARPDLAPVADDLSSNLDGILNKSLPVSDQGIQPPPEQMPPAQPIQSGV